MRHLKIPKGANKDDIWERVIVPLVMRKYQNMKCNLNNDIKSVYMSMTTCLCESTFAVIVNYTEIYFIICLINAGERTKVWPDELGKGFQDYVKLKLEHVVYDFMCTYVRRIKPDTRWKKILKMNAGNPFICPMWNKEGLAFYYTVEKNWKEIYNDKEQFFCANEWVGDLGAQGQEQEGCHKDILVT